MTLKCYCEPPEECLLSKENDSVCYTNTGCFHSIISDDGYLTNSFGCFKNDSHHYLMSCFIKNNPSFKIFCCRHENFCNKRIEVDIQEDGSQLGQQHQFQSETSTNSDHDDFDSQQFITVEGSLLQADETWYHTNAEQLAHTPEDASLYSVSKLIQYLVIVAIPAILIILLLLSFAVLLMKRRRNDVGSKNGSNVDAIYHCESANHIEYLSTHQQPPASMNLRTNQKCCAKFTSTKKSSDKTVMRPDLFSRDQENQTDAPSLAAALGKITDTVTKCSKSKRNSGHGGTDVTGIYAPNQSDKNDRPRQLPWTMNDDTRKQDPCCARHWLDCCKAVDQEDNNESEMSIQPYCQFPEGLPGTSGSGSGQPFLVKRTIARQIQLQQCVGTGRFGEVWRGTYEGEDVAVKIFSSRDEASWVRETTIFNKFSLRHENLIGFVAGDIISSNGCTQLWMVMPYHAQGALYDYLQQNTLNIGQMLRLARSAAAGLCYLHSVIDGVHGKPGIAHRDIKSKNILIQSNNTCCIADLGLAVVDHPSMRKLKSLNWIYKAGTKRYMSPELLNKICVNAYRLPSAAQDDVEKDSLGQIGSEGALYKPAPVRLTFDILKASDVYAFGLVMWELARRCNVHEADADPYLLPYGDRITSEPTFCSLYELVCIQGIRPPFSPRWFRSPIPNRYIRLIQECWCAQPEERLTMLRIKKTLSDLMTRASSSTSTIQNNLPKLGLENETDVSSVQTKFSRSSKNVASKQHESL